MVMPSQGTPGGHRRGGCGKTAAWCTSRVEGCRSTCVCCPGWAQKSSSCRITCRGDILAFAASEVLRQHLHLLLRRISCTCRGDQGQTAQECVWQVTQMISVSTCLLHQALQAGLYFAKHAGLTMCQLTWVQNSS